METGSLRPLPLAPNQYLSEPPDLPTEEARRVQFSKREALPNHYNIQTPTSRLQSIGS
jgi:hypothetical protein